LPLNRTVPRTVQHLSLETKTPKVVGFHRRVALLIGKTIFLSPLHPCGMRLHSLCREFIAHLSTFSVLDGGQVASLTSSVKSVELLTPVKCNRLLVKPCSNKGNIALRTRYDRELTIPLPFQVRDAMVNRHPRFSTGGISFTADHGDPGLRILSQGPSCLVPSWIG
jgi:hypothetical protein